jgi:hypothetical protein
VEQLHQYSLLRRLGSHHLGHLMIAAFPGDRQELSNSRKSVVKEVIMTGSYLKIEWLKYGRCNWSVVVVMVIFLGVAIAATDCQAQAVPSRTQSQIMTKPIVPSPESPLQKEIRENRQQIRATDRQAQKNKIEVQTLKNQISVGDLPSTFKPFPDENGKALESEFGFLRSRIGQLEKQVDNLKKRLDKLENAATPSARESRKPERRGSDISRSYR